MVFLTASAKKLTSSLLFLTCYVVSSQLALADTTDPVLTQVNGHQDPSGTVNLWAIPNGSVQYLFQAFDELDTSVSVSPEDSLESSTSPTITSADSTTQITYTATVDQSAQVGETFGDIIAVTDAKGNKSTINVIVTASGGDTEKPVLTPSTPSFQFIVGPGGVFKFVFQVSDDSTTAITTSPIGALSSAATPSTTEAGVPTSVSYAPTVSQSAQPGQLFSDTITIRDADGNESVIAITIKVPEPDTAQPIIIPAFTTAELVGPPGSTVNYLFAVFDASYTTLSTSPVGALFSTAVPEATAANSTTNITYTATIPTNARPIQTYSDTISIRDAEDNTTLIAVTVRVRSLDTEQPAITPTDEVVQLTVDRNLGTTTQYAFQVLDGLDSVISTNPTGGLSSSTNTASAGGNVTANVIYSAAVPANALPNQLYRDTITIEDTDGNRTEIGIIVTVAASDDSIGAVIIDGDFILESQDTLQVELSGTGYGEHDTLLVGGSAIFNGTLELVLKDGYMPKPGDSYTFTMANSITGAFDNIILPDIGENVFTVFIKDNYAVITVDSPNTPATPLPIVVWTNPKGSAESLSLNVEVNLATTFSNAITPQAKLTRDSNTYDVFVAAFVPGEEGSIIGLEEDVWFLLDSTSTWGEYLDGPLAQYLSNITLATQEFRIVLTLLRSFDVTSLSGATFFIGFGTSEQEMLESQRYRAVFVLGESQTVESRDN